MESERPHRSIFTSKPSSSSYSSMKIFSKSILSPGHTHKFREPTLSLSSSMSRRLRSNGSMKGGQSSPMFPTGSKKRGCAFDTPEPSSPKVTCIGEVRGKTKKQRNKIRTRSKQRWGVSFSKTEQTQDRIHQQLQKQKCLPHRNQKWVHLPFMICEALRAFGAEFNCFFLCRSSCSSTSEREKEEKRTNPSATTTSSCGAVFARWLMALQEGEEKGTEIELVVGEEKETEDRSEEERERKTQENSATQEQIRESAVLPDCLLLMMFEPKLSMEVSKETWVCSTDFIRRPTEKKVVTKDGGDEFKKRMIATGSNPSHAAQQQQQPQVSCSNPAAAVAPSMATMIEQRLRNAVAYEPFVLTRCKSEPIR